VAGKEALTGHGSVRVVVLVRVCLHPDAEAMHAEVEVEAGRALDSEGAIVREVFAAVVAVEGGAAALPPRLSTPRLLALGVGVLSVCLEGIEGALGRGGAGGLAKVESEWVGGGLGRHVGRASAEEQLLVGHRASQHSAPPPPPRQHPAAFTPGGVRPCPPRSRLGLPCTRCKRHRAVVQGIMCTVCRSDLQIVHRAACMMHPSIRSLA
jgi:hypothetical protein